LGGWGGCRVSRSLLFDSWSWQNVRPSTFTNCNDFIALRDRVRPFQTRRLRTIHEGGMSHAAKPAPASRPNAKTATPVITRPGVRDARVQCVARRGSAMGTRQKVPRPRRNAKHDSCRPPSRYRPCNRSGQGSLPVVIALPDGKSGTDPSGRPPPKRARVRACLSPSAAKSATQAEKRPAGAGQVPLARLRQQKDYLARAPTAASSVSRSLP
jgi:hypothetical protein